MVPDAHLLPSLLNNELPILKDKTHLIYKTFVYHQYQRFTTLSLITVFDMLIYTNLTVSNTLHINLCYFFSRDWLSFSFDPYSSITKKEHVETQVNRKREKTGKMSITPSRVVLISDEFNTI